VLVSLSAMKKSNLCTKSFSPCPVTQRCYHYCHGLDIQSESNDIIWTWLLDHQTCRKVIVAHEVENLPVPANACVNAAIPNNHSKGSGNYQFTAFGETDTVRIVEDSSGVTWEISAEVAEGIDNHDAIHLRTYRLRSRSQSQSGKMENSSETACDSSVEYFVRVYFLHAPWSLTALPSIATFIRQVKLFLVLFHHSFSVTRQENKMAPSSLLHLFSMGAHAKQLFSNTSGE
jgi:hypothetical protein